MARTYGIERGVGDAERQLRVHLVVELDAAGARHRQARRRRFHLVGHQQARASTGGPVISPTPSSPKNRSLALALDVVARLFERAAAVGGEIERAVERRIAGIRRQREGVDGDAAAVDVERIGAVPADIGGAGHGAAALLHLDAVEAHAGCPRSATPPPLRRTARRRRCRARSSCGRTRAAPRSRRRRGSRPTACRRRRSPADRTLRGRSTNGAIGDANARVDLLAAVGARIAERELAGHVHPRQARSRSPRG